MRIWAIQSLVTGVLYLCLSLFVLSRGPKQRLNRFFSLFTFCFAVWSLAEAGHRFAVRPETAYFWIRLGGVGWCFMLSFYFNFILDFAGKKSLSKGLPMRMFLYLPPLGLFYLFLTTDLIYKQEVTKMTWGYTSRPGDFVWIYMAYYMLLYLSSIFFLIQILRKGGHLEKKQAKPILLGCSVALVIGTATNVVLPALRVPAPELGTLVSVTWMIGTLYAVLKYKLFIIEPNAEEIKYTEPRHHLQNGNYLIKEERLDKSYEIFVDQLASSRFGLCLSKLKPSKVRARYGLARTPIVWVTLREVKGTNVVSPRDLDALESAILNFLNKVDRVVTLIDCFAEIKLVNGFHKASDWLERIRKACSKQNCVLLVSVSSMVFESDELSIIERAMEAVE